VTGLGVVAGIALLASLVLRHVALEQVTAGHGRWGTPALTSTVVASVMVVAIAASIAVRSPMLGVPLTILALLLAGVWLRATRRRVTGIAPGRLEARVLASADRLARAYHISAGILVTAAFVGVVALLFLLLVGGRF